MTNEHKLEIVKNALEKGATIRISLYDPKTQHEAAEAIREVCGCNGEYGCGEGAHWVEVMEEDFYVTAFFEEEKTPRRQPEPNWKVNFIFILHHKKQIRKGNRQ